MENYGIIKRHKLAAAISAALLPSLGVVVSAPAFAQDTVQLEEVVVTATRRAESIQDIPINISSISGDAIESRGLSNLSDIMRTVPGIHIIDQGSRAADQIIVRGINADPLTSSEALGNGGGGTVATYVGEIPIYVDLKLNDMARVEVLLGPQGTLYGAGALSGAIRYIPNKPNFDSTTLEVRGDIYSLSESDDIGSDTGFTFNLPFSDTFALRANLDYLDDPGYIDYTRTVKTIGISNPDPDLSNADDVAANLKSVKDVNTEETLSARVALRWNPNDQFDSTLTYFLQDSQSGGRSINSMDAASTGEYETALRVVEPNDRKTELLALEMTVDLGFAELTSATGYSEFEEEGNRDQTDLLITLEYSYEQFPNFTAYTQEFEEEERFNQELRLVSTSEGPLSWIVGGFYNNYKEQGSSIEYTPEFDTWAIDNFGAEQERPDNIEYYSKGTEDLKEYAAFGELSYDINEQWTVTVGARYYEYEFTTSDATDFPLFNTIYDADYDPTSLVFDFEDTTQKEDGTLFKFNIAYQVNDDIMTYFTRSEGYRIGAGNGIAPCPDPIPEGQGLCALPDEIDYKPDQTVNYEIGLRSTWLDGSLVVNGAIFLIEWEDPQLASTTVNASVPITVNGDGAESQGIELSFNWRVSEALIINGSYAYAQAELTSDAVDLVSTLAPNEDEGAQFYRYTFTAESGDRLPGSPEQQASLFATYSIPVQAMNLDLNYGISAISDVLSKAGGLGSAEELPGFAVHNFSADLSTDQWTVSFYADNLLNKYAETGVRADSARIRTVSDINGNDVVVRSYGKNVLRPRSIGLRASYRFDM